MPNSLCVIDSISAHRFRIGMGNPCVVHLPPGPDDWYVWLIDWAASAFFLVRLRTCDCSLHHRRLPRWTQRDSELSFPFVSLALLARLVCLFVHRDSAGLLGGLRGEGDPFCGPVSVYFSLVTMCGIDIRSNQRPSRGVRLARPRAPFAAEEGRADMG